ncbi:5682_t:CDS:1, partial [Paraglomus occultum]
ECRQLAGAADVITRAVQDEMMQSDTGKCRNISFSNSNMKTDVLEEVSSKYTVLWRVPVGCHDMKIDKGKELEN